MSQTNCEIFTEIQGTASFALNEGDNNILILADFQDAPLSRGFTMTLNAPAKAQGTPPINPQLTVHVDGERTFAMQQGKGMGDSLVNEMDLHYVLTSTAPGGYDAFWSNRQQALIFRF